MRRRSIPVLLVLVLLPLWSSAPATQQRAPLSLDLQLHKQARPRTRTRVIVEGDRETLQRVASKHRLRMVRELAHGAVLELNAAEMDALAADGAVANLSGDLPVASSMTVENSSTLATKVRAGEGGLLGLLGSIPGVNGQGVGIALLDSGITYHKALGARVAANVSFVTGDASTDDGYGHGTHIAGIITGTGGYSTTSEYNGGIAPGAHLVNVRVLDDEGKGYTSDVIAGIDWVIANRSRYNIRVINMSLGHPVTEPSALDPLCLAVKRAYDAGLMVVVSAGNRGKDESGAMILGGVTSPGNSPHAITVGALNTWNTVSRSDDTITTYSSRGPTRYDLAAKPDLSAPGNKVVSLEANGSRLTAMYPEFHVSGYGSNAYSRLSGTSMAAGMVTGGVALLLQGNPYMTPARVKFAVQIGSSYLVKDGVMAGGAGSVNLWPSRKMTSSDLVTTLTNLVTDLLSTSSGVSFTDGGTMTQRMYQGTGVNLYSLLQLPSLLLNPLQLSADTLHLAGTTNSIGLLPAKRTLYGDVSYWTASEYIMWGDTVQDPEGNYIMWGDNQTTDAYYIMWGDTVGEGDPR
jgi:subtilisin family serine protease